MKTAITLTLLALWFLAGSADAACTDANGDGMNGDPTFLGTVIQYAGDCEDDNEVLIQTGDMSRYSACLLVSTTGAVDVFISIDGTNYTTAATSLTDHGATTTAPVLVTTALRLYGFNLRVLRIRVLQNGATDAAASLLCWDER